MKYRTIDSIFQKMRRQLYLDQVDKGFNIHPIVAILGPRQCGKTTLSKQYCEHLPPENYFDLEDPEDRRRLENPKRALETLSGIVIIDEIQRMPSLFEILRVLVDRKDSPRFLILGSASRDLINQSPETLAGRIDYIELPPFCEFEVHSMEKLWLYGGFPRAFLSDDPQRWLKSYVRTYLEKDIPSLGLSILPDHLHRFWMMLSHYHGCLINFSEIGRSLDLSYKTIQNYIDLLSGTFIIRVLKPWHENIKKRQTKMPKIYFRDSGLLHYLLGVNNRSDLLKNPKLGSSWEGFALEQIVRLLQLQGREHFYFWNVHAGAELDLLVFNGTVREGFEFKYSDAPSLTKSLVQSKELLKLDKLYVIYPGQKDYEIKDNIYALSFEKFVSS